MEPGGNRSRSSGILGALRDCDRRQKPSERTSSSLQVRSLSAPTQHTRALTSTGSSTAAGSIPVGELSEPYGVSPASRLPVARVQGPRDRGQGKTGPVRGPNVSISPPPVQLHEERAGTSRRLEASVQAEMEQGSTCTDGNPATQDGRLGSPGSQQPSTGVKPSRGGAENSQPGGEGNGISSASGYRPSFEDISPYTATLDPQIVKAESAQNRVDKSHDSCTPPPRVTGKSIRSDDGEVAYQCQEVDTEFAEDTQNAGSVGGPLSCAESLSKWAEYH
jgi:hypothetical protein